MRGRVGPTEILKAAARCEAGADRRAAGKLVEEERIWVRKFEGDRVLVDLAHLAVLAVDLEFEERRRCQVFVQVNVVVPEHEIVGGERLAIRPPGALAQIDRRRPAIIADLPVARETGDDLGAGVIEGQDLVERIDPVAVLVIGGTGERTAPVAAVLTDFMQRLDDEELRRIGQSLVDGGELARLHQRVERRGFLERLREGLRIEDDLRSLELADQRRANFWRRGLGRGVERSD